MFSYKIGFIGGGKMCQAILNGILKSKKYSPKEIIVTDTDSSIRQDLQKNLNVITSDDNKKAIY